MKFDLSNITVNGVPLEIVVDQEHRSEINHHQQYEMRNLAHATRSHIVSKNNRNISGSRSGKCRVIMSAGVMLMKQTFKISSMSDARRKYTVVLRGKKWSCSCPGWKFHTPRKNCKHILQLKAA
jgi:hypothetical protein